MTESISRMPGMGDAATWPPISGPRDPRWIDPEPPTAEEIAARVTSLLADMSHSDAVQHVYDDERCSVLADELLHAAMRGDRLAVLCAMRVLSQLVPALPSLRELAEQSIIDDADLGDCDADH